MEQQKKELFQEVNEGYTMAEAMAEAKRCLNCKVPQCRKGCPISQDIPDWIHELSMGNMGNAMKIINGKSNLPAVCGRVCPQGRQCEGMGRIRDNLQPKTRGRIAVIGSGPAGLSIAGDLARKGFNVEIFEMEPEPGGVLMFGIPEYRLPKEIVHREIKKIEELGVIFHCNTTVGTSLNIDQLFGMGFDAIFIGTGTVKPKKLDIPGRNLKGVRQAVYFLRKVSLYNEGNISREDVPVQEGDRVFVIGCGNTAMDGARTAIRMGAKSVEVIYHRTIDRMSALRSEYDEAVEEGVKFNWESSIVEIHDDNGTLNEVVIGHDASRGKQRGYILTRDVPYGMTTRKGVFAGGDVVNRPSTVVLAMQDAKLVADGIAQYVDAIKLLETINTPAV